MNKKLLVFTFIISIFSNSVLHAQSFQTDERVWDLSSQRALGDLGRMKTSKPTLSEVEGSEYFDINFKDGIVKSLNGKIYLESKMRYNAFHDEIELIIIDNKTKNIKALLKDKKIIANLGNSQYIYLDYKRSNQKLSKGYLISIYKGTILDLYQRKRKKFLKGKVAKNSLDVSHPPRYVDDIEIYISRKNEVPINIKKSKKSVLNYFNKSKEIKSFIKYNNFNFDNFESFVEVIKFYESSQTN